MAKENTLSIVLEFLRGDSATTPYVIPEETTTYISRNQDGTYVNVEIPWSDRFIDDLLTVDEAQERPDRVSAGRGIAQRFGAMLRSRLAPIGWEAVSSQIVRVIDRARANNERARVMVTVRSAATELYSIPWELLTLNESGRHLGVSREVIVRYEWPGTVTTEPNPRPRPEGGRILFAWAGADVPRREHGDAIANACGAGHLPFDKARDILPNASIEGLRRTLAKAKDEGRPYTAIHLLCHGAPTPGVYGLELCDRPVAPGETPRRYTTIDPETFRLLIDPSVVRLVVLAVCNSGDIQTSPEHRSSLAQVLHRNGVEAVVASRFKLTKDGSVAMARALYQSLLVDSRSLEQSVEDARHALSFDDKSLDWMSVQLYARAADGDDTRPIVFRPYQGLNAFSAKDERFYYGREMLCREIVGKLRRQVLGHKPRVVLVDGASGTGKSSFVRAGVVPEFVRRESGAQAVAGELQQTIQGLRAALSAARDDEQRRALQDVITELSRDLARAARPPEVVYITPASRVAEPLEKLRRVADASREPGEIVLVVIERFDKIYAAFGRGQRDDFMRVLVSAVETREDNGVRCIVSRVGKLPISRTRIPLLRLLEEDGYRIDARENFDRREAIEHPARAVGLVFEEGLVEEIINDVRGAPGELALLQYTLHRLWERRDGRMMTFSAFHSMGGALGAFTEHAQEVVDGLDDADRSRAVALLNRLAWLRDESSATLMPIEELHLPGDGRDYERVINALVGARVLVREVIRERYSLALAHRKLEAHSEAGDAYITKHPELPDNIRALARWIKDGGVPYTHVGFARRVQRRHRGELSARMHDEINAKALRLGAIVGAFFTLLVAIALLWLVSAYYKGIAEVQAANAKEEAAKARAAEINARTQEGIAKEKRTEARRAAKRARDALRISAAGLAFSDSNAALAIGFLREVGHPQPQTLSGWSEHAREFFTDLRVLRVYGQGTGNTMRAVHSLVATADGHIWAGREDHSLTVYDRRDAKEPEWLSGHAAPVRALALAPSGKRLVSGDADGTLLEWDVESQALARTLTPLDHGVRSLEYRRDGARLLIVDDAGTARIVSADSAELLHTFDATAATFQNDKKSRVLALTRLRDGRGQWRTTLRATPAGGQLKWELGEYVQGEFRGFLRLNTYFAADVTSESGGRVTNFRASPLGDATWDLKRLDEPSRLAVSNQSWLVTTSPLPEGSPYAGGDRIRIWETDMGDLSHGELRLNRTNQLVWHEAPITAFAFPPTGKDERPKFFASADEHGVIAVWGAGAYDKPTPLDLWRATAACPSTAMRVRYLGDSPEAAAREHVLCEKTVQCLDAREGDAMSACLDPYRVSEDAT